jgi:glutamate-5-semialdehyde dehydrogenase
VSSEPQVRALTGLTEGQEIPFGGNRVTRVGPELAESFREGDRLIVVQATGALLHIPATVDRLVAGTVTGAVTAFAEMASVTDDQISDFFDRFALALADDVRFAAIADANASDVAAAAAKGRSTTRLVLDDRMRSDMVRGLQGWRDSSSRRGGVVQRVDHESWTVEARRAPLGVVGFVFEGRPNVFADACGVVRTGNTVVFRIGSDALATARAIVANALEPALREAGLPPGTVCLVDSATHAAGHALFADGRLALAVARGSGPAVAELGAVATQTGTPVSLHGTGGAWMVAGREAASDVLRRAVRHSLDRKVCNTLNVVVVLRERADEFVPVVLAAVDEAAAARGTVARLHVVAGSEPYVPAERFERTVSVARAAGPSEEPWASIVEESDLATEWEWEGSPEVSLVVVETLAEAVALCNRYSPRFVASIVSEDPVEVDGFDAAVDAPFVGNGFTRWVDGQYALDAPELGLSNWQFGRLLGRGAILSGDSVHTIRYRATVADHDVHR